MARSRSHESWNHTASMLALIANCHTSKGRTFKVRDFHPFEQARLDGGGGKHRVMTAAQWDAFWAGVERELPASAKAKALA